MNEDLYKRILAKGIAMVEDISRKTTFRSVVLEASNKPSFTVRLNSVAANGTPCTVRLSMTVKQVAEFRKKGRLNKGHLQNQAAYAFDLWNVISLSSQGEEANALGIGMDLRRELAKVAASTPGFVEACQHAAREACGMLGDVEAKRHESHLKAVKVAVDAAILAGVPEEALHGLIQEAVVRLVMDS